MGSLTASPPLGLELLALTLLVVCCWLPLPSQGQLFSSLGNTSHAFLFPSQGDLLIGRVAHLTASSTCGETRPQTYCPIGMSKCSTCDSKLEWDPSVNRNSHKIGNVVAKIRNSNTTYDSWWMSEPGVENVTIQLDLDTKFTFTHLIMIFHSYRPKAWWLERSSDYGRTYKPYGYFAEKCDETFSWVKTGQRQNLDDVVCSSDYTEMTPSDRGQVVFNAVPQHITETEIFNNKSVDSKERRESQTDITNLRVHLLKYHTLSDEKLSPNSPEINKYYFGLYEMNVHGMCICNGHAMTCKPADDMIMIDKNAVYGYCECMHNTQGPNCEECRDFYHDRMWAPATMKSANECRRCNCHGHSNKCTFSPEKLHESSIGSGGLCLECMHNTTGDNCQRCVKGYYRDEVKLLDDPEICLPCQCSTIGIDDADSHCEPESDKARNIISGHCKCKSKVAGKSCNGCKPGFWNLRQDNPEGCQECSCVLLGTRDNLGCDQYTGQCNCKSNVDGDRCDRCKPGFFNLSQAAEGCSPCRCNIGGSLTPSCDSVTGDCTCKPGFTGRQCHIVIDRYYVPNFNIDGAVVQVEDSPDSVGFPRVEKSQEPTLTGECGVQLAPSPAVLVILLRNKTKGLPTGEYDIVIKAYPVKVSRQLELPVQLDTGMDSVNCTSRPPVLDSRLSIPSTEEFNVLDFGDVAAKRPYLVKPVFRKVCIDAKGLDKITIQLFSLPGTDNVILDAVVIGKNLDDPIGHLLSQKEAPGRSVLPPFKVENMGELVTNLYNCLDYWKAGDQSDRMPVECRGLVQGLSGRSLPSALQCRCEDGARSPVCEKVGGQCYCYPNIVGRTCNQCAPSHYGFKQFRDGGCKFCNCTVEGSMSQQCDSDTGQCVCNQDTITGRTCDRCKLGYWSFPMCLSCACNDMAPDCDKRTGDCVGCRDNTGGSSCQECKLGYFGDPAKRIPCRRCQCPGGIDGSVQHAATCQLKPGPQLAPKCDCESGYLGDQCNQCEVNHYGNPNIGSCTRCSCNGNINFTVPESCDPQTGRCTKCLNETTGASCEECRPGFHGEAAKGSCAPCYCNEIGTSRSELLGNPIGHRDQIILYRCNSKSGECRCLPNVEGRACSSCKALHYNLTSREGCSSCACDPLGSRSLQCDTVTGQCPCISGRGGRRCDQCLDMFYGDPSKVGPEGCQPCDCHPEGSMTIRCDKVTGKCVCKSAITGRRCDQCERGTTGALPNCTTCGECWYNWDRIIQQLSGRSAQLKFRADEARKSGGLTGDYSADIRGIDADLAAIGRAIDETTPPTREIQTVRDKLKLLGDRFNAAKPRLDNLKFGLRRDLNRINSTELESMSRVVSDLSGLYLQLKLEMNSIRENLTHPSLVPPSQTLNRIRQFERRFTDLEDEVRRAESSLNAVALLTDNNKQKLDAFSKMANDLLVQVRNRSKEVAERHAEVERKLPQLNKDMCVGFEGDRTLYNRSSNYCSDVCGGPPDVCSAAFSQCGESSVCQDSVVARRRALHANLIGLEGKILNANLALASESGNLTALSGRANTANIAARSTEARVSSLITDHERLKIRASRLRDQMLNFTSGSHFTDRDIQTLVRNITSQTMPVSADRLLQLAEELKALLKKLRDNYDVSKMSSEAKATRETVLQLLQRAQAVDKEAIRIKAESAKLSAELAATKGSIGNSTRLLAEVQKHLNDVQDVVTRELSLAIKTYEDNVQKAIENKERLNKRLNETTTRRAQLNYRLVLLSKEQQETKEMLSGALTATEKLNLRAARDGVSLRREEALRREKEMEKLRAKVAELHRKLGGGRGQLHATQSKIASLETSLALSLNRIAALMTKLNGDSSTYGSLAYMLNLLEKRCGTH